MSQVPEGDLFFCGVVCQPAFAAFQEFIDLGIIDIVMFLVVQYGDEYIEMVQ